MGRKKKNSKKDLTKKTKLGDVAKKFGMSVPGVHHEIKRIINKMVDRLKPSYFAEGLGVFEIVLDLADRLGVKNNPGEIFNKLNATNKKLCIIQAKKRAPHLAKLIAKDEGSSYEDLLDDEE